MLLLILLTNLQKSFILLICLYGQQDLFVKRLSNCHCYILTTIWPRLLRESLLSKILNCVQECNICSPLGGIVTSVYFVKYVNTCNLILVCFNCVLTHSTYSINVSHLTTAGCFIKSPLWDNCRRAVEGRLCPFSELSWIGTVCA